MTTWLVKSEEDTYSVDDLKRDRKTSWSGVRNYQARNYLCQMKVGEEVFFYHSNCEIPGIVGVAQVIKTAYADETQYDKKSEYFDAKATREVPRWFCPELKFVKKFRQTVSLEQLREVNALKGFQLLQRGSRLSVMPVSSAHFKVISNLAE